MEQAQPFVREAGNGPSVVCLHANASTSSQWRSLMDRLSPTHRVMAPDLYGSGQSPDWPSRSVITLDDESDLIEPILQSAGESFALVGHSYGGAVALIAALRRPEQVSSLVLYEPTLFSLVDAHQPPPNRADGIRECSQRSMELLALGEDEAAAGNFIDYWMGAGAWAWIPEHRRGPITESVRNIERWGHALSEERTPLEAFSGLTMPVLYLVGQHTKESSRAVADLLVRVIPNVEVVEVPGIGHMGPVTHPEVVNQLIAEFLEHGTTAGERAA
ncbi:MAG: alpha/beta fold hydrolase [Dehalococcoidia bacterium]